ncbi:MAG: dihydroorotase family protein [archaeon]
MLTIIKNTYLIGKKGFFDILIEKGTIKKISEKIDINCDKIIEANGNCALPGAIDVHVHMREPGYDYKEDWTSGSLAALNGGVTTVLDMPNNKEPIITKELLLKKIEIAKKKSKVNFGLYYGLSEKNLGKLHEVADLVYGYKLIMEQTTGDLCLRDRKLQEQAFAEIANIGKIIIVHAEDPIINEKAKERCKGRTDHLVHADSRPNESEESAIRFCIDMAKKYGTKTHITHLSTKEGLELIKNAKKEGVDITCDTTHSYLFLTRDDLLEKGAFAKMNPPLRSHEDVAALWKGLNDGTIDMIATDHAPHTIADKYVDFFNAPNGLPHLDLYYPMLLDAVNKGIITLEKLIKLTAENPAKRFGFPKKGKIEVGYDADIVIANMNKTFIVTKERLKTKCGWSVFEKRKMKGTVVKCLRATSRLA